MQLLNPVNTASSKRYGGGLAGRKIHECGSVRRFCAKRTFQRTLTIFTQRSNLALRQGSQKRSSLYLKPTLLSQISDCSFITARSDKPIFRIVTSGK